MIENLRALIIVLGTAGFACVAVGVVGLATVRSWGTLTASENPGESPPPGFFGNTCPQQAAGDRRAGLGGTPCSGRVSAAADRFTEHATGRNFEESP